MESGRPCLYFPPTHQSPTPGVEDGACGGRGLAGPYSTEDTLRDHTSHSSARLSRYSVTFHRLSQALLRVMSQRVMIPLC